MKSYRNYCDWKRTPDFKALINDTEFFNNSSIIVLQGFYGIIRLKCVILAVFIMLLM